MSEHHTPADSAHHAPTGFHGPKCWVVSAIVGALLGLVIAHFAPAQFPTSTASGTQEPASDLVVIQTNADGSMLRRRADYTTTPIPAGTDLAKAVFSPPLPIQHTTTDPAALSAMKTHTGVEPIIPLWLCAPFALLLLSIALMPFVSERFWHAHFPDFAFFLGALMLAYYLRAFGSFGAHAMLHVGAEYYAFIALVGGLFVASGGILVDIRGRGTPFRNTLLLAFGAIIANLVGTTGASVLLIRPFLRLNRGRLRPIHVVFFIFIVSNCGGCLTPIGDPPLYLGFLKGVPFSWTLNHLWPMWLFVNGTLLCMYFLIDLRIPLAPDQNPHDPYVAAPRDRPPVLSGLPALICLVLLVASVFIDPMLKTAFGGRLAGLPIGPTVQIILAALAYFLARPSILHANQFTFAPVKEVGFLFIGIFLTMAPALGYLQAHASEVGLESPTQFYFGTGGLSAFLDNAPTYLSFLQVALGILHLPLNAEGVQIFISSTFDVLHQNDPAATVHFHGQVLLEAISLGAVFFGAMTYIGNGPNFMVKSIVDQAHAGTGGLGVKMPSFLGYLMYAVIILLPVLVLNWFIFIR